MVGSLVLIGLVAPFQANAGHIRMASGHGHGGNARHAGWTRHAWHGGHLQCVPFARSDSGIELTGNAAIWWNEAAGRYERGARPEPGSVLSFSSQGRMRLGHVAVVAQVVNAREIEIDHANWWGPGSYGGVNRGVPVVDVSPNNDWTEVRVALGDGRYGSVYRTHGFIYDRPDSGAMIANNAPAAPIPALDAPTQREGAPGGQNGFQNAIGPISLNVEVAEAPAEADLSGAGLRDDFGARSRGWGRYARSHHARLGQVAHAAHPNGHHHRG